MSDDAILAREAALLAAMFANDVTALDDLLDDELVFVALDGTVVGKEDDLAAHRARRLRLTRAEPSDRRIVHCGSTVVVTVRMDMTGTYDDVPFSGPLRYTRIWCERDGRLRIVAGHMSAVQS